MYESTCPHCGKAFKIDETGFADILKHVRGGEFESTLHEPLEVDGDSKRTESELAETQLSAKLGIQPAAKVGEIEILEASTDHAQQAEQLA